MAGDHVAPLHHVAWRHAAVHTFKRRKVVDNDPID